MIVFLSDSDRDRNKEEDEAGEMNEVTEEAAQDTEEEGVNSEQKIISEKFSCNLNWRFIVKPESKSPIP